MIVQNAKYALQVFYIAHIYAGDHEKTAKRTSSINWPKDARAQEVAQNFISCNPFFTILITSLNLLGNYLVGGPYPIFTTYNHLCNSMYVYIIYMLCCDYKL